MIHFSCVYCVVPPNITSADSIVTVLEGGSVKLTIVISNASPSVSSNQIEWVFLGTGGHSNVIYSNGHYNFSLERTDLTLTDVRRTDRGNYTIAIGHETGVHFFSIELFVTGKMTLIFFKCNLFLL